jgi:hypothetical protein
MARTLVVAVVLFAVSSAHAQATRVFRDGELGFGLSVDTRYVDAAPARRPTILDLQRAVPGGVHKLKVVAMGGTIGRAPADHAAVERGARKGLGPTGEIVRLDFRPARWKAFTLEMFVMDAKVGGVPITALTVQVPLRNEAIQIVLAGPATDAKALETEMNALLASLTGESSWLTEYERGYKVGEAVGRLFGVGLVIALIIWAVRRRKRQGAA